MEEAPPQSSSMSTPQTLQFKYDLTSDNYVNVIADLRDKARVKDVYCHGLPVLPLENDANPPYMEVYLEEGGTNKGFAKIRRYDLRLINYKDPLGNLFIADEFQLYDDDSKLVKSGIEGLLLGFPAFMNAVNYLANNVCKERNDSDVRTSLAVLCLVLCEGTKLDLFSCMLANAFKSGFEVTLSSWLLERLNDWEFFSSCLNDDSEHDPTDCNYYLPYEKIDWHDGRRVIGVTCQDVAQCLGIIRGALPIPCPMQEEYLPGKSLFEIFSVSVYLDGGRSGSVFGTIKAYNDDGGFSIYQRDSNDCEFIESHGTLSLQGPDEIIFIPYKLDIEVDLKEAGSNEEISKGKISWTELLRDDYYDSRNTAMVRGTKGYAIVYFTVSSKAILAQVEVTLLTKDDHPHANKDVCVCGRLSALYSDYTYVTDFHDKYYQIRLFDKPVNKVPSACPCTLETKGMRNPVKLQEAIKLSRSRVTVPVDSSLIIKADLKTCQGKPIVTGSMEWIPKEFGEFEDTMEGHLSDSHLLHVKVKWIEY